MSKILASQLLDLMGGKENIASIYNCMTRVRVVAKDHSKIDMDNIKNLDGVNGVVDDEEFQIILGPGAAEKTRREMEKQIGEVETDGSAPKKKGIKYLLKKIGNIFIPLIPALVASGLINGAVNFAINSGVDTELAWVQVLQFIGGAFFTIIGVLVGFNTAKEFGGTPALGAISGALIFNPALDDMELFGESLVSGRGGLFAVMMSAFLMAILEQQIRKVVPNSLDLIVTSTLTVFIVGLLTVIGLQPVGAVLSDGIIVSINWVLEVGGVFAGAVLAATFLPLVLVGLHHGLTPIHLEFIQDIGYTPIFTILGMAGAGQVGAAVAIFVKTKSKRLKNIIKGTLPVGFLGIGEPLLYGVTLPLGRPFLTACLGAAFGGAYQALMTTGAINIGVSGISLVPLIAEGKYIHYIIGLILGYAGGFSFTYMFGFKEKMVENLDK